MTQPEFDQAMKQRFDTIPNFRSGRTYRIGRAGVHAMQRLLGRL
jgi:hypothetical protein